jgi:magnesium-transporting ATPase (P-type)
MNSRTKYRLLPKGASEIVLNSCKFYLDENENRAEINDSLISDLNKVIHNYAEKTL